jgi:hypothetical protein
MGGLDLNADRIVQLEQRMAAMESRLQTLAGILASFQPAGRLMASRGVSEQGQEDVYRIVDEMSVRVDHGDRPSFAEFEERIIQSAGTGVDRRFVEVLVDALKIERPQQERLYDHFTRAMDFLRA